MTGDPTVFPLWKEPSLLSCLCWNLLSPLQRHGAHACFGTISHSVAQTGLNSRNPPVSASPGVRITGMQHHTMVRAFNVFLLYSHYFLTLYFQCFFWSFPSTMDILSRYSNTWPRKKGTKPNTNVHPAVTQRAPPGFQFWHGTRRGSSSMHFCIYGGFYPKEFLWKYFLQW